MRETSEKIKEHYCLYFILLHYKSQMDYIMRVRLSSSINLHIIVIINQIQLLKMYNYWNWTFVDLFQTAYTFCYDILSNLLLISNIES